MAPDGRPARWPDGLLARWSDGPISEIMYVYHPQVLDELARHGLNPLPSTPPQQLRDAVRDLYKYEIKRLRSGLLAHHIRKQDYADHVVELRKRYRLLSIPTQLWLVKGTP